MMRVERDWAVSAICIAAAALLGGCTPMNQAALVYSSKVQVGVQVAAGTAETPGVELNAGINANDVAFVPAAVSRLCEDGNPLNCASSSYDVHQVRAYNNQGLAAQKAAEANRRVEAASRETHEIERVMERVDGKTFTPAELRGTLRSWAPMATTREEALRMLYQELVAARQNEAEARTAFVELSRLAQAEGRDGLNDALSVYGTFNGSATGTGPTAGNQGGAGVGVGAGKVFSTGVASQLLATGIARGGSARAVTECLAKAEGVAGNFEGEKKKEVLASLSAACAR